MEETKEEIREELDRVAAVVAVDSIDGALQAKSFLR